MWPTKAHVIQKGSKKWCQCHKFEYQRSQMFHQNHRTNQKPNLFPPQMTNPRGKSTIISGNSTPSWPLKISKSWLLTSLWPLEKSLSTRRCKKTIFELMNATFWPIANSPKSSLHLKGWQKPINDHLKSDQTFFMTIEKWMILVQIPITKQHFKENHADQRKMG